MIRLLGLLLVAAIVGAAAFVYDVKYEAERLAKRAGELIREIEREHESIAILRAEWSHLNQPARLQALAERHLPEMRPQTVAALALPHELPERPMDLGIFLASLEREGGIRLTPLPVPPPRASAERPAVQSARPPVERVARANPTPPRPQARPSTPPASTRPTAAPAVATGAPLSLLPPSAAPRRSQ